MTPSQTIRVMIVDDQPAVRSALTAYLLVANDLELVGTAANGQEAVELCGTYQPDIILMDIRMPKMDGVEATRQITQQYPHVSVLALTSFLEPDLVQDILTAGAAGYLLKNIDAKKLSDAIRATCRGESVLDKAAYKLLFQTKKEDEEEETVSTEVYRKGIWHHRE